MNTVELEQGSAAWLDWRRSRRMASETPAVTRRSPYQGWDGLRRVKRGENVRSTPAMAHGHKWEHEARLWAAAETGHLFTPAIVEEGDYAASLDGIDRSAIVEIKCPFKGRTSDTWQLAEQGLIRPDYDDQVTHQLAVSGALVCYFVVFDADTRKGIIIERTPDVDAWKSIASQWDAFWPWHLTDDPDPALNVRNDADWMHAALHYTAAKRQADRLAKIADAYRKDLIALAGVESASGCGVRLTRFERKGSIDYKAATSGMDIEQYRKAGTTETRISID